MGLKCIVCGLNRVKSGLQTLHSFPRDSKRRSLWMAACKIKLCLPSYRVCSFHFTVDQYEISGYLKKEAVPMKEKFDVLILSNNELHSHTSTSKPDESVKATQASQIDCSSVNNTDCVTPTKRRKLFNANTIGDLDVCHFSTPSSAKRHLMLVKDKYKNQQIQNHNLKKQRKRLQNKLAKFEDLVQQLQTEKDFLLNIVNAGPNSIKHTSSEKEKVYDEKIMLVEHDHNYLNSICVKAPRRPPCA